MARDHARILTAIWADDDFVTLPSAAQRLYMLLLTQPGLTYAGTQDLRVNRWASRAADTRPDDIWAALFVLDAAGFVVVDQDTEEILLRSYVRVNEVWKQPKLLTLALRQIGEVQSRAIRHALRKELLRLPDDSRADPARTLARTLPSTPGDTPPRTLPGTHDGTPSGSPADTRAEGSRAHAGASYAGARVTSNHEQEPEATGSTSRGDLTEVDAGANDVDGQPPVVPDTPPRPLEDPTPDEPRRSAPAVAVHENARPPERCRNHLELADPPPCGRCKEARIAAEQWDAANDAKIAASKAAVAEEQRETKRLERQAIADCGRCNENGQTPHGTRCGHGPDDEQIGPGRAAARQAMAELRSKAAAKAKTDATPPATGEQLRLIAMRFQASGVNDRDNRLTVLGEIVGRPIGSSRELTRAEASVVLDRFDHPLPDEPPEVLPGDPDYVDAEIVEDEADDEDDLPTDGEFDQTGGFEDIAREEQHEWAEADAPADYVYAGGPDDPPF